MKDLKRIQGNTWYIDCTEIIPVYFLNEREIVLLDNGLQIPDGDIIRNIIDENDLSVRAVICSHIHPDHTGNSKMLQNEYHAEVIINYIEDALNANPLTISAIYKVFTPGDAERDCSFLIGKADRVFMCGDEYVEVDGVRFGLQYLPGHTAGHTAISTPDDVIYLGDALLSGRMLTEPKLLTIMDWAEDLKSKEKIRQMNYSKYVLAHKGIFDDVKDLVDANIKRKDEVCDYILDVLRSKESWTNSEFEIEFWNRFELHAKDLRRNAMYRRNLMNLIEYLVDCGRIERVFSGGTCYYSVSLK